MADPAPLAGSGVPSGGEADGALAQAEPALDLSKHKSGIIPVLQCVAAAAGACASVKR